MIILCFETYFLVQIGLSGGWTTCYTIIIFLQTIGILVLVAMTASSVYEEVGIDFRRRIKIFIWIFATYLFYKLIIYILIAFYSLQATEGFEALRGAFRNKLTFDEERSVSYLFL